MNYVVLVKTNIDNNIKHNSIEKIPYKGKISLESMYKLCECDLVDIKDIPLQLEFDGELEIIPAVTLVFDEEFLLKSENPVANELASVIVTVDYMTNACAVTCCCATQTKKATAYHSVRVKRTESLNVLNG